MKKRPQATVRDDRAGHLISSKASRKEGKRSFARKGKGKKASKKGK